MMFVIVRLLAIATPMIDDSLDYGIVMMQRYASIKLLGDGTYGSVSLAKTKDTGELVAIKKLVHS